VLGSHEQPLRELDRRVAQAEAQYAAALETLSAARIDAELDGALISSIRVIDRPSLPIEPLGLGVAARTAFGFVAGLVLAVAALLLLQFNDSRQRFQRSGDAA